MIDFIKDPALWICVIVAAFGYWGMGFLGGFHGMVLVSGPVLLVAWYIRRRKREARERDDFLAYYYGLRKNDGSP